MSTSPIRKERQHRRGDRWLMALSALIALAAMIVLGLHVTRAQPPVPALPTQEIAAADVAQPTAEYTVQFGGDTMLADGAMPLIATAGYDAPLARLLPVTAAADTTVVNAEAPITTSSFNARPGAKFTYAMDPAAAAALAKAGVNVLALNNNHVMDRGAQGLTDTIAHARAAGLQTVGAGANAAEAEKPLILSSPQGKVAIVNIGENFGPLTRADEVKPGAIALSPATVQRGLDLSRAAGATTVIGYLHWGDNYSQVNDQQRYWAEQLVKAGYDVVIGAGSHTAQRVEVINGRPVVYGLGNFSFGSPGRFSDFGSTGFGLTATVVVRDGAAAELRLRCLAVDNENRTVAYQARPCLPQERAQAFAHYAPQAAVVGDAAVLGMGRG